VRLSSIARAVGHRIQERIRPDWVYGNLVHAERVYLTSSGDVLLKPQEASRFQVQARDGRFLQRDGVTPLHTVFRGGKYAYEDRLIGEPQRYLLVLAPDDTLYASQQAFDDGGLHHTAFTNAGPVAFAGEVLTDQSGRPVYFTNKTGHYPKSGAKQLQNLAQALSRRGFNLADVRFGSTGRVPIGELIANYRYLG
jgi:hypothetical protein